MTRRLLILALVAVTLAACGDGSVDRAVTATTTSSTASPPTTAAPVLTTASVPSTAPVATTAAPAVPRTTAPATTTARGPMEEVVDSGVSPIGPWQLVVFEEPNGVFCAGARAQLHDTGPRACNRPTEQDFNGDDTLRYAAGPSFLVGVTRPSAVKVAALLRDGTVVERPTKAASFTSSARFVALPLPTDAVIRSVAAVDGSGNQLTRITINP